MKLEAIAVVSAVVVTLAGCGDPDRPGTNPSSTGAAYNGALPGRAGASMSTGASTGPARADGGSVASVGGAGEQFAGSLGDVRGFASDAAEVQVQGNGAVVRLDAVDAAGRWWAMTQLHFDSPLSSGAWVPGLTRTFEAAGAPSADGLMVTAIGCSGPSRGRFTFDSEPQQVTVRIEAGASPGARVVHFEERWTATGQIVTGTFTFAPR